MLSILIPIYNYNVSQLVLDLIDQAKGLEVPTEIICYDDHSDTNHALANKWLEETDEVRYHILPANVGRSAIRNQLATAAAYPYLLYLDCDSGIVSENFLSQYLTHLNENKIICGGRNYSTSPPTESNMRLHWLYGTNKESRPIQTRQAHPVRYFHTNNFIIPKRAFEQISFDETIQSYGYEDLLFAEVATGVGLSVVHIDNPVRHMELQNAETFLSKTTVAVRNLIQLNKQGYMLNSKLENTMRWIKRLGIGGVYKWFYRQNAKSIESNLKSENPSLTKLDLFKLYAYLENQ